MPKFLDVTDPAAARRALGAASVGSTVVVEDFREDGLTDGEIIGAAFDAVESGGEIRFGNGVTYTLTEDCVVSLSGKDNILIDGQGAILYSESASRIFSPRGEKTTTTTTLTAAITARTKTLTVASTAGFEAGDMISIKSDTEMFSPDYESTDTGVMQEMARVTSVTDATTLVLDSRTWNTYSISGYTVTVTRYVPMRNLTVRDLNVVGGGSADQVGFDPRYFDGLNMANVKVSTVATVGISPREGINVTGIGCRVDDSVGYAGSQGYGFSALECQSVKWIGCYGRRNRHSFDAFMSRDILHSGCTADDNSSAGISTHASTDVVKVIDCTVRECGGGIILRGKNNTIRNNHILGTKTKTENTLSYRSGIMIGQGGGGNGGVAGTNLVIDGNYIDISGPDFASETSAETGNTHAVYSYAPLVNAKITNNDFSGFPACAIAAEGITNDTVLIAGNRIDCSGQESTSAAIYFKPFDFDDGVTGHASTGVAIKRNDISGGCVTHAIILAGGYDTGTRSDEILIDENDFGPCDGGSVSPIYLQYGYYGSSITVRGNQTGDIKPVQLILARYTAPPLIAANGYGKAVHPLASGQEVGARMRPGFYYGTTCATSTITPTLNRMYAAPLFVPRRVTVDRIGITVTIAATAGSTARLGIYADTDDGYGGFPGEFVTGSDGVVATDSATSVEATISATINPGLYWLACLPQGAAGTLKSATGSSQVVGHSSMDSSTRSGYIAAATITGSLPSSFGTATPNGGVPYVTVRVSSDSTL